VKFYRLADFDALTISFLFYSNNLAMLAMAASAAPDLAQLVLFN
jgi:hypothetical protein